MLVGFVTRDVLRLGMDELFEVCLCNCTFAICPDAPKGIISKLPEVSILWEEYEEFAYILERRRTDGGPKGTEENEGKRRDKVMNSIHNDMLRSEVHGTYGMTKERE